MTPHTLPRRHDMVVTRWGARFMGRSFPCSIGRGGIADTKVEGDGVTPAGIWQLLGGGYRADQRIQPHAPFPLKPIGPADIWSDDPADPAYNNGLRAHAYPFSHEKLRMGPPLYDIFLISDQNFPDAIPGKGSALFLHQWRKPRHPTAGCIAFAPEHLAWILARWTPRSRVLVR